MKVSMIKSVALVCSLVIAGMVSAAVPTVGTYSLNYDWGCDGSYSTSSITLSADGTFNTSSYSGTWTENNQTLTFVFQSGTYYTGYHTSKAVVGVQKANSLDGCFYMLQTSTTTLKQAQESLDADGMKAE
ncbi:hypothetical protein VA7868_01451 [Vibrio aerogenes CECT 7868]|uniref:Uncharacterized protein n=1 Tax=Vibrio aerogenes CECT 7868 TaxID=1216006 RepID=A0A1M5Y267_9VIBR|nr:hypothetical protein [Vibrio aerogenes]SHI06190.1 hypothetical protein VA7868_01451 [Vibrio aerogenes CECT 7868]